MRPNRWRTAGGSAAESESKVIILISLKIVHGKKDIVSSDARRRPRLGCRLLRGGCGNHGQDRERCPHQPYKTGTASSQRNRDSGRRCNRQPDFAGEEALPNKSFTVQDLFRDFPKERNQERGGRCSCFRISEVNRTLDAAG